MQSRGCGVEELALGGHGTFLPRALWSLGKNHLTACNRANPETIFPYPFFVNGRPETAPVLGGEEEWSTESEAENVKGGFPFIPFLSLIFFFSFLVNNS